MNQPSEYAGRNLAAARRKKPLVHCIVNLVTLNTVANVLLAAGGSPVMAFAPEEVEEVTGRADALVLNTGTLTANRVHAMLIAGRRAVARGIPIVLDPVGVGMSAMRNRAVQGILSQTPVQVLRGNPSEVLALRGTQVPAAGVDAVHTTEEAQEAAVELAAELQMTVAVTGSADLVTDGRRTVRVENGHPLLTRVTGTGCAATALIGMFLAVEADPLQAAATALAFFGLAAEIAARGAEAGPGRFGTRLLDALYAITPEGFADGCRIEACRSTRRP